MLSVGSVLGVLGSATLGVGAGVVALILTTSHATPASSVPAAPAAIPMATASAAPQ